MKRLSLILFALCLLNMAVAQDNRPGWVINKPKAGNSSYVYVIERGGGVTVNAAINNALTKVLRTTMMRCSISGYDDVLEMLQGGTDWSVVAMKYNIPVNKVCEYVEQKTEKGYRVVVLCQVAKTGNVYPEFDEFTGCNDIKSYDPVTALIKSAFLPGLGQMGKHRTGAGVATLAGELVFIGGAVSSYTISNIKLDIMKNHETSLADFQAAKSSYYTLRAVNIASISAAAALYMWNLYRAYTITPDYKKGRSMAFTPTLMPVKNGISAGLGLTLNF